MDEATASKILIKSNSADSSNLETNKEMEELNPSQSDLISKLPNEIIEAILTNLTNGDILKSRQVSRKWYESSSRIWSRRHKNKMIRFCNIRERFLCSEFEYKSLNDLIDCFKDSVPPYTHFDFGDLTYFKNEDIKRFVSMWGQKILGLKITMFDPINSVATLRNLLLEQVTNLKVLDVQFTIGGEYEFLQLFDNSEDFQIPNLEILVVNKTYRNFPTITKHILSAACNLKRLELSNNLTVLDLQLLESVNKLHILKKIKIHLSKDFIDYWSKSSTDINLKLQTMKLRLDGEIVENQQLKLDATSVVNRLLESIQNVIETLALEPIDLITDVVFPKLKRLIFWKPKPPFKVSVEASVCSMFEKADVFPNLQQFDIHINEFPSTQQVFPSIKILRICGSLNPSSRDNLTKMTPNVTTLSLYEFHPCSVNGTNEDFVDGFRVILNNLTKLETFNWIITQSTHLHLLYSIDAAMTGLPLKFCKQMLMELLNKDDLSAKELASIESRRSHSSILDLKELKTLTIQLNFSMQSTNYFCSCGKCDKCWREGGYIHTSKFYRTGFTKVGQFLALDQMPNVKINICRSLK